MYAWWYLCIGLGFVLLGMRSVIRGDGPWSVGLRLVIALGFFALGVSTLRSAYTARRTK